MITEKLPLRDTNGHVIPRYDEAEVHRFDDMEAWVSAPTATCTVCDSHPRFQVAGNVVEVLDPCPYPNGITTKIALSVPSGKLIVTDTLRPVYWWDRHAVAADYNSTLGQAQAVEAMAALGCAFGPILHGAGLYRTGPDSYIIANTDLDENDDPSIPGATRLANISADVWTYSIADFEHWKARGGDPASLDSFDAIVDVAPGVYEFTHHSGERSFVGDASGTVIFAHVERIA
ncbi:hypothetical protein OIU91_42680 (plasmid) [Streptomyces sp. NBC_01456]|uniref:hypothetical protein n=1 Tax=unclassified Streptomyces TaxID=2593676 RepID=UPI002E302CD3|nr:MULTISPECIES: hypothetical protein [unclassified Streptomyces]